MKVGVIGSGYVGLVAALVLEMGNKVICVDVDENKIRNLKLGNIPIYEPGIETLVSDNQKKGTLFFTTNIKEALDESLLLYSLRLVLQWEMMEAQILNMFYRLRKI